MIIIRKTKEMQEFSDALRRAGKTIAVVPTMGFLHEGHLSLIDTARKSGADAVIVTIFVPPCLNTFVNTPWNTSPPVNS